MGHTYTDEEGNEYSEDQVRAATQAKVADESGQGSFGGVHEDDDLNGTPTSDIDTMVKSAQGRTKTPERELNPSHFGDFVKSNIYGGMGGGYISGERPMTLFDVGRDVLASSYGGVDLAKRDASYMKAHKTDALTGLKAERLGQQVKTGRAQETSSGLQSEKYLHDLIAGVTEEYDSNLWESRIKEIAKAHNIEVPATTIKMMNKWLEDAKAANVSHPSEVLDHPENYEPSFVNRTRHTFALANKHIQESQQRVAQTEQANAAGAASRGEEGRKSTAFGQGQASLEEQVRQALSEKGPDGQPTDRARGRAAALLQGGKPREAEAGRLAGTPTTPGGRNLREQRFQTQATEELGENATPGEVAKRAEEIRTRTEASKTGAIKVAGLIAEGKTQSVRAKGQIQVLRELGSSMLTRSTLASFVQPLKFFAKTYITKDPQMAAMQAVPGSLSNLARGLGEKGVLTDRDLKRVESALSPRSTDTWQTFSARLAFVDKMIDRGQAALEKAGTTGTIEAVDGSDLTFEGDPLPNIGGGGGGGGGGGNLGAQAALDEADQKGLQGEERRAFLAEHLARIKGGK